MEILGFRQKVEKLAFKVQRRKLKTRENLQGRKKYYIVNKLLLKPKRVIKLTPVDLLSK